MHLSGKTRSGSADCGAYHLLIRLPRPLRLRVGRLGVFGFPAGWYVYTGSAMNGLRARVARHVRGTCPPKPPGRRRKRLRWHIDYLLRRARLVEVALRPSPRREECRLNARVAALPGATIPVPGFGSSDCRCRAHLVRFPRCPRLP